MEKKLRIFSVIVAAVLLFNFAGMIPVFSGSGSTAIPAMSAFEPPEGGVSCSFSDVSASDWFYDAAAYAQSLGLISGKNGQRFAPYDTLTWAEAAAIAVRIYESYYGLTVSDPPVEGDAWYDTYLRRAVSEGLLTQVPEHPTAPLTRSEAAALLCRSLPETELPAIRDVNSVVDTVESNPCYPEILMLYRAGVLVGTDRFGSFRPDTDIMRCEFASLLTLLLRPESRSDAPAINASLSHFSIEGEDPQAVFSDVPENAWYFDPVSVQETLGLMSGTGNGCFSPNGTVSLAQAVSVTLRVYEKYCGLPQTEAGHGADWYLPAVEQARSYGLLNKDYPDYSAPATRTQIVSLLYRSLHAKEFTQINNIDALPDMTASDMGYSSVLTFYRAGILCGTDVYGTVRGNSSITRAELAAILTRLVLPEQRQSVTLRPIITETITYGTSGSGKHPLTAYRIGNGENVMVLTFAIHGWEDNFDRDGKSLVYTAEQLNTFLTNNYSLVDGNNWTVYILPCLNPDGLYEGSTCNGPGRCTLYYYDSSGKLIYGNGKKGIDINRCFPYQFVARTGSRNFNGTAPLQCPEAVALDRFVRDVRGSGANVLIDNHGWYTQILGTNRNSRIYTALHAQFPQIGSCDSLSAASGYLSAYCGYVLGYDAALFEFPDGINSQAEFVVRGDTVRYCAAISDLLQHYFS